MLTIPAGNVDVEMIRACPTVMLKALVRVWAVGLVLSATCTVKG